MINTSKPQPSPKQDDDIAPFGSLMAFIQPLMAALTGGASGGMDVQPTPEPPSFPRGMVPHLQQMMHEENKAAVPHFQQLLKGKNSPNTPGLDERDNTPRKNIPNIPRSAQ